MITMNKFINHKVNIMYLYIGPFYDKYIFMDIECIQNYN